MRQAGIVRESDNAGKPPSQRLEGRLAVSKVWAWVCGIAIALCILGLPAYGRAERRSYWIARGAVVHHAQVTPHPIDRLMQRSPGR